jgi:prephenate dehydratase
MKVSIQGQLGSYHDIAAQHLFGPDYEPVCRTTFRDVFLDVSKGHTPYALISIENSLYGSINQVYDLLLQHEELWIAGEIYMRIEHCLIGLKKAKLEDLKEVHSHPIALAQCEDFLEEEIPYAERFANHDTAGSLISIKKWGDPTKAAIGSVQAAKLYGLSILKRGIESHHQNYTRFIVLTLEKSVPADAGKTSFVLMKLARSQSSNLLPGNLYHTLGCFAERGINLSKIESRPVIGRAWNYIFYLDFEMGLNDPHASEALNCLEGRGAAVRVLGSYPPGKHIH